jgi:hypothetical protein
MTTNTTTSDQQGPSAETLIRWSGLAAIAAGAIFAGIQPVHPPDELASVTTGTWAVIITLKFVMCLLFLVAITGLYARQIGKAGWLGFAGFVLFATSWFIQTGYVFVDLFVLPPLATAAPQFIDSFLGIVNNHPGTMDIGAMVPVYAVLGLLYLVGGILLGVATFRAGVLPRVPAGLLAITALLTPAAALLPHAIQRYAAIPMGVAVIWLGWVLWSERRAVVEHVSSTLQAAAAR